MENTTKYITLAGIIAVIATGTLVMTNVTATPFLMAEKTMQPSNAGMLGHVTLTVYDDQGHIKKYVQTDNTVVNQGKNCVAELLFGVATAGGNACGTADGTFDVIGIGKTQLTKTNDVTALGTADSHRTGSISLVQSATTAGDTAAIVKVTRTFSFASGAETISEAILLDSLAATDALAYQTFADIGLGTGDKLTVDWTVNLG